MHVRRARSCLDLFSTIIICSYYIIVTLSAFRSRTGNTSTESFTFLFSYRQKTCRTAISITLYTAQSVEHERQLPQSCTTTKFNTRTGRPDVSLDNNNNDNIIIVVAVTNKLLVRVFYTYITI